MLGAIILDKKKEWLGNLVAGDDVMVISPTRVEYAKVKRQQEHRYLFYGKNARWHEFVGPHSKRGVRSMPNGIDKRDDRILPPNYN